MKTKQIIISFLFLFILYIPLKGQVTQGLNPNRASGVLKNGFADASEFGFLPEASGLENQKALQAAADRQGTIVVSRPGTYKLAGTVYIGSNISLIFGNNVFIRKVDEKGTFSQVFLNKGALTKTFDQHISIEGLNIIVNGVDKVYDEVYGLRGHLAFFYVKDLKIERFRCMDLGKAQYCIHICTFEDLLINDVIIKGDKDGIHLGNGNRFTIRNGVFYTFDDAVALNAFDYANSNPELGWIENGVVEKCYDMDDGKRPVVGYFSRILAGGWADWKAGMDVQHSDAVVSNGRIYRVQAAPDGTIYHSVTQPAHTSGSQVIDKINWGVAQDKVVYSVGVRNVVYRDIFLEKPRTAFSINFNIDKYCRSYYPGAEIPVQENISFDNIRVTYNQPVDWLEVTSPVDALTIINSGFKNSSIVFKGVESVPDYKKTRINILGCIFGYPGKMNLLTNKVDGKEIILKMSSNMALDDNFSAIIGQGKGKIMVESDLKIEEDYQGK